MTRLRVLVVEDHPDVGEMLAQFLEYHGCDVRVAKSVTEARQMLEWECDVLITDIGLPDGSGLELAAQARGLAVPPRLLVTYSGASDAEDLEASRRAGFDRHLVKPLNLDALRALIDSVGRTP